MAAAMEWLSHREVLPPRATLPEHQQQQQQQQQERSRQWQRSEDGPQPPRRAHHHHHHDHHHHHHHDQHRYHHSQHPPTPPQPCWSRWLDIRRAVVTSLLAWALLGATAVDALPTPSLPAQAPPPLRPQPDWGNSPPPGHVFGSLADLQASSIPERLGLVNASGFGLGSGGFANCTNCPWGAADSLRKRFEDIKLKRIQMEILSQLHMPEPPNVSVAAVVAATDNRPVSKFLEREREELRQSHKHIGPSNYAEISEIICYGEQAANFRSKDMVMFRLSTSAAPPGGLKVMSASLYMMLRYRKSHDGASLDKPHRRVKVNIYPVYPEDDHHLGGSDDADAPQADGHAPGRAASAAGAAAAAATSTGNSDASATTASATPTTNNTTMFGSLGVLVRHTRWQKLILPVSEIQKVLDSPSKLLHLRITCDNCGRYIEPVLVARRNTARRKVRAGRKRKFNKRRPLLIVHTAVDISQRQGQGRSGSRKNNGGGRRHPIQKRAAVGYGGGSASGPRATFLARARDCSWGRRTVDGVGGSGGVAKPRRGRCTKRRMKVDFKDMGWDEWILYPRSYYANYCEGACAMRPPAGGGFGRMLPSSWAGSGRRRLRRPEYCCTPSKTSDLHLIYFDENGNIIKTLLRDMVVDECTCA